MSSAARSTASCGILGRLRGWLDRQAIYMARHVPPPTSHPPTMPRASRASSAAPRTQRRRTTRDSLEARTCATQGATLMRTTFANSELEGTTILPHNYTLYSNTYLRASLSLESGVLRVITSTSKYCEAHGLPPGHAHSHTYLLTYYLPLPMLRCPGSPGFP